MPEEIKMNRKLALLLSVSVILALFPLPQAQAAVLSDACTDKAVFVNDITVADGTRIEAGKSFDKVWRLKNSGTCTWNTSYSAVFVSGQQMSGPAFVALPKSVKPGENVDVTVKLTAPSSDGTYQGYWKLRNANGVHFGIGTSANESFWVKIVVGNTGQTNNSSSSGSWKGEYFANTSLSGTPKLTRTDAKIDFNWKSASPGTGIPKDNFSVRWTRTISFGTGIYRFRLSADDRAVLRVGDRMVLRVPAQPSGDTGEQVYDLAIFSSSQKVTVEYREFTGSAKVRLTWEKITPSFSNWKGEYWTNTEFKGNPAITRNDKVINFRWNEKPAVLGMPRDNFSVRWTQTGKFENGTYRFRAVANEGIRVYVDGKRVINQWGGGDGKTAYTTDRQMSAGNHKIVVEYFDRGGNAIARLSWERLAPAPTASPTSVPTAEPTPVPTAVPTEVVSEPTLIYSFAEQYCFANWKNAGADLVCPGSEADAAGYVKRYESITLENSTVETKLTLLLQPELGENGMIQGTFPAFSVQAGDHFQSVIACPKDAAECDATFRLGYRIDGGELQNLGTWTETNDGQAHTLDVDLSSLAGKSVQFVLSASANGPADQARALWVLPRIMR